MSVPTALNNSAMLNLYQLIAYDSNSNPPSTTNGLLQYESCDVYGYISLHFPASPLQP
jgi:hypothetical protein